MKIGTLEAEQRARLDKLISKYSSIFDRPKKWGANIRVQHQIELKPDTVPFRTTPRRVPPLQQKSLDDRIEDLLKRGIILSLQVPGLRRSCSSRRRTDPGVFALTSASLTTRRRRQHTLYSVLILLSTEWLTRTSSRPSISRKDIFSSNCKRKISKRLLLQYPTDTTNSYSFLLPDERACDFSTRHGRSIPRRTLQVLDRLSRRYYYLFRDI